MATQITKRRFAEWIGDEATDSAALFKLLFEIVSGQQSLDNIQTQVIEMGGSDDDDLCDGTCEECGNPKIKFTDDTEEMCECLECGHKFESNLR